MIWRANCSAKNKEEEEEAENPGFYLISIIGPVHATTSFFELVRRTLAYYIQH